MKEPKEAKKKDSKKESKDKKKKLKKHKHKKAKKAIENPETPPKPAKETKETKEKETTISSDPSKKEKIILLQEPEIKLPAYKKVKQLRAYLKEEPELYNCPECPNQYLFPDSLQTHIAECHQFVLQQCPECTVQTKTEQEMKLHQLVHQSSPGLYPRQHRCDRCQREFRLEANYRIHRRSVCTERFVKEVSSRKRACPVCG
jgi:hypothetical protein